MYVFSRSLSVTLSLSLYLSLSLSLSVSVALCSSLSLSIHTVSLSQSLCLSLSQRTVKHNKSKSRKSKSAGVSVACKNKNKTKKQSNALLDTEDFLGEHTMMPAFRRLKLFANPKEPNILSASNGKLPPYVIVVGHRNRVLQIASLLSTNQKPFPKAMLVHKWMKSHNATDGRVNVAVGMYHGVPIAIVEHQVCIHCFVVF